MNANREKIIKKMSNIVADLMRNFQTDYTESDRPQVENAESSMFPMLWIVAPLHTYLIKPVEYAEAFGTDETYRFRYVESGMPYSYYFDSMSREGDHLFLITEDDVREITAEQGKAVVKDVVTPAVVKWRKENGPLLTKRELRLPIKFKNISLSELKGLIKECEAHNDKSLLYILRQKRNSIRVSSDQYWNMCFDAKHKEFSFAEYIDGRKGLNGGIVFHGWPETGYMENGSVQLEREYGWQSHT